MILKTNLAKIRPVFCDPKLGNFLKLIFYVSNYDLINHEKQRLDLLFSLTITLQENSITNH